MQERIAEHIRPSINFQQATYVDADLKPVEIAIFHCLMNPDRYVLVERVPYNQNTQGSALYIALRRRGFQVCYRAENGVKNVWARWPHDEPHLELATFGGVLDKGHLGAMDTKEWEEMEAERLEAMEAISA